MNSDGKQMRAYLSITLTSLTVGSLRLRSFAPFLNVWMIIRRRDELVEWLDILWRSPIREFCMAGTSLRRPSIAVSA